MPSKTLKLPRNQAFLWKDEPSCSESEINSIALQLARELKRGDRVVLEGQMGAGKTTFARALLLALKVVQPPEGSPSFAIAHEYEVASVKPRLIVVHIDFYRIKDESEIEDAGLPSHFWDPDRIVISEWLSSWPVFEETVFRSGTNWVVRLSFPEKGEPGQEQELATRAIRIEKRLGGSLATTGKNRT